MLDGVNQAEVYIRDAYILRDMRKDYNLFNSQLGILGTEKETFTRYLLKEKTISDIAEDQQITYESARQQIQKIKVRMKKQVKKVTLSSVRVCVWRETLQICRSQTA